MQKRSQSTLEPRKVRVQALSAAGIVAIPRGTIQIFLESVRKERVTMARGAALPPIHSTC